MISISSPDKKQQLRAQARRLRRSLDPEQRARFNARITDFLVNEESLRSAQCIAAFCAFDGEPDISPAFSLMHARGQQICLPCIDEQAGTLDMKAWSPESEMTPGLAGIDQPGNAATVALNKIDVLLIPLVAWDDTGNRIGMGAAYYDRYLAQQSKASKPRRIGIAYHLQRVEVVPAEHHDVPLHALVSETGWTDFGGT